MPRFCEAQCISAQSVHHALHRCTHDRAQKEELGCHIHGLLVACRRESQLVEHFITQCNRRLAQELEARREELKTPGTHMAQRFALLLRLRLEMLQPHISSWPQVSGSNLYHAAALFPCVGYILTSSGRVY